MRGREAELGRIVDERLHHDRDVDVRSEVHEGHAAFLWVEDDVTEPERLVLSTHLVDRVQHGRSELGRDLIAHDVLDRDRLEDAFVGSHARPIERVVQDERVDEARGEDAMLITRRIHEPERFHDRLIQNIELDVLDVVGDAHGPHEAFRNLILDLEG